MAFPADFLKKCADQKVSPSEAVALRGYRDKAPGGGKRLYLSARFDRYVDYPDSAQLFELSPSPDDGSITVWLKPGTYTVVTETHLDPGTAFVRGQLVDDFMSQPEAQVAWDEQNFMTGKTPSARHCYA